MENSVEKHDGTDLSKRRSRSLDLYKFYEGKSTDSARRGRTGSGDSTVSGETRISKRKHFSNENKRVLTGQSKRIGSSAREIPLNIFEPFVKRRRKNLNISRLRTAGFSPGIGKPQSLNGSSNASQILSSLNDVSCGLGNDFSLPPGKKKDELNLSDGNAQNSNGLAGDIIVPKRPRGISRRKKHDCPVSSNKAAGMSSCSGEGSTGVQNITKLSGELISSTEVLAGNQKKSYDEFMENGASRCNSVPCFMGGDCNLGRVTQEKAQRDRRKRQKTAIGKLNHVQREAFIYQDQDSDKFCEDFREDDEENLEQNAARMLSSRFDPRCTGFSGNRMTSYSKPANKSSLFLPLSNGDSKHLGSDTSSIDKAGRVLRPRKQNGKCFNQKRRHFYEVSSRNIDPYWVLKRRIRVFWPLDQTWYFGLVKDYNPATKLHHVKYDDRDEEWINLQKERFKLLLFPSELTSKFDLEKSGLKAKQKNEERTENAMKDSCLTNIMESEPIITWLSRSARRMKPSMFDKRSFLLQKDSLSEAKGSMAACATDMKSVELSSSCIMPEQSIDEKTSGVMNRRCNERKLTFVYFRRRFHKRMEGREGELDWSFACRGLTSSARLLASFADGIGSPGDFNANMAATKPRERVLKFRLPLQWVICRTFAFESFWLCDVLLISQYGTLMPVWPMVHIEIVFLDNVVGLRFLSFEGCLQHAVELLCLIIRLMHRPDQYNKLAEFQLPFTSFGFKLSCLEDEGRSFPFTLYNFLEMGCSQWVHLDRKLKQYHVTMRNLPLSECTYANNKNLLYGSNWIPFALVYEEPTTVEGFQKISWKGTINWLDPYKSANNDSCIPLIRFSERHKRLSPFSLSFAAAPTSFLFLHFKFLVEKHASSVIFQKPDDMCSLDSPLNYERLTDGVCSPIKDSSDRASEIKLENLGSSFSQAAASSGCLSHSHSKVEIDALSLSNDGDWMRSYHSSLNSEPNVNGNSVGHRGLVKNKCDEKVAQRFPFHSRSCQGTEQAFSSLPEDSSSPEKSEGGYDSCLNTVNVQTQCTQIESHASDRGTQTVQQSTSGLAWNMNNCGIHSPNLITPRSTLHHNRQNPVSPSLGHRSKLWLEDFIRDGFFNGYKKPRTQVSYSLPYGGHDFGSESQSQRQRGRPYKKVKFDSAKMKSAGSGRPQSFPEANVLITLGDRGWRESGAQIMLDSDDQKDWQILVKLSGATKYSHKVHQILQPGTNRYTHAMMWKGGKDWTLEFTDRSQWTLFKELHGECYSRNIRAASVKNIPIPGVRLIEDPDDYSVQVPFVRSSNYIRQAGTEVNVAMDPSHFLYDMDSDDEEWISKMEIYVDSTGNKLPIISEEIFGKAMDMFEKVSFAQQCDKFTDAEIDNLMAEVGPLDVVKAVHEHWRQKRQKKGMPLIRQFQPALWEKYQQQVKEWELALNKLHNSSNGCQVKSFLVGKPPMFAFCLRPRGLEVPNKGSTQRSHKKFTVGGGHHNSFAREHDDLQAFGRKTNGYLVGEERALITVPNYDSSDASVWVHSPTSFSPRDVASSAYITRANSGSDRNRCLKFHRNNSKMMGMSLSPRESQMMSTSYGHRAKGSGICRWNSSLPEWSSTKQLKLDGLQRHPSDIDEFRLRDASSAAQHASNMAKLKREKAQWLLHKADLAVHKAVVALMTADAIKTYEKELIVDG